MLFQEADRDAGIIHVMKATRDTGGQTRVAVPILLRTSEFTGNGEETGHLSSLRQPFTTLVRASTMSGDRAPVSLSFAVLCS